MTNWRWWWSCSTCAAVYSDRMTSGWQQSQSICYKGEARVLKRRRQRSLVFLLIVFGSTLIYWRHFLTALRHRVLIARRAATRRPIHTKGRTADRPNRSSVMVLTIVPIDLIQIHHRDARSDDTNAHRRSALSSSFAPQTRFRRKSSVQSLLRVSVLPFNAYNYLYYVTAPTNIYCSSPDYWPDIGL